MKKWYLISVLILILLLAACGAQDSDSQTNNTGSETEVPTDFSFGSATVGGFWYTLSGAMAEDIQEIFPNSSVTIVEGGSISNIMGLNQGLYSIGIGNAPNIPEALEGKGEFAAPIENVSTIATLYPNVLHIAVPKNSDIQTVEDLKGKRVSPGIRGYSAELTFIEVLEFYGMSYDDLAHIEYIGTADAGDLLRDGHIDAIVSLLAAPVSTIQELDTTLGMRLIPLDKEIVEQLHDLNPGYLDYTIEGGTYSNINEDIQTVAGHSVLLASNDLISEEAGYELTKMIFEKRDKWEMLSSVMKDFNVEFSVENSVTDFHPGAERYYREVGALE